MFPYPPLFRSLRQALPVVLALTGLPLAWMASAQPAAPHALAAKIASFYRVHVAAPKGQAVRATRRKPAAMSAAGRGLSSRIHLKNEAIKKAATPPAGGPPSATPLYVFTAGADGGGTQAGLVQGSDGNFYGTTTTGGAYSGGTVFQMKPDGTLTTLASVGVTGGGRLTFAPLVEGLNADGTPNGTFFGTAYVGGKTDAINSQGYGTVFKLAPDTGSATGYTLTDIYKFTGPSDGANPRGPLVPGRNADGTFDGFYYGTTLDGGNNNATVAGGYGTVFKVTPDGVESVLYAFEAAPFGDVNHGGWGPQAGLVQARNADKSYQDAFLGTATRGGVDNGGSVFKITREGTFTDVYEFLGNGDPASPNGGTDPTAGTLVQATDGAFYGLTTSGGAQGYGIAYRLAADTASTTGYTVSNVVDLGADDLSIFSGLIQASDGAFYGTGNTTGTAHLGTVYRIAADTASATGFSATTIYAFPDMSAGYHPADSVIQAKDGDLYGTTFRGGGSTGNGSGTVFRLNIGAGPAQPAPQITPPVGYQLNSQVNPDGTTTLTATVTINGVNFVRGGSVNITNFFDGTTIDSTLQGTQSVGTQIIVTLSKPLRGGNHQVTVTNPDGQSATAPFTTAYAPKISAMEYYVASDGSLQSVAIQGDYFVKGVDAAITNQRDGTAHFVTFSDAQHLFDILTQTLPAGSHSVTVTNPDGQSDSAILTTLDAPIVTGSTAVTDPNGVTHLIISGRNFGTPGYNGSPDGTTVYVQDANGSPVPSSTIAIPASAPAQPGGPQQIIATLDTTGAKSPLTAGIINADNQSSPQPDTTGAKSPLTAGIINADNQSSPQPGVAFVIYAQDQTQYAIAFDPSHLGPSLMPRASLPGLLPPAYHLYEQLTGTPVLVPTGAMLKGRVLGPLSRPNVKTASAQGGPEIALPFGYSINPDGTATLVINGLNLVRGADVTISNFFVGTTLDSTLQGDQSVGNQIVVILSQKLPAGDHQVTITNPDGQSVTETLSIDASDPTQVLVGQLSLVPPPDAIALAAMGPGSAGTGLISPNAARLISNDGGGVISNDGGTLITNDGGTFTATKIGIVAQGGGNIVAQGGGNIVAQGGGNIIAQGGGNVSVPISSLLAAVASGAGITGSLDLAPQFKPSGLASLKAHALPNTPISFILTKHDASPARGKGVTDYSVRLNYADGTSALLLDLHFAPGQPDVVVYQAPGVTLKPRGTTPAPLVTNPVPTLLALSLSTALAGSPDLTLAVTGTLLAPGAVVNWNGKPLATTVVSGTHATAIIPASLLSARGTAQITVANPAPGGGASAPLPFVVTAPPAPLHTFPAGLQMLSVTEDYTQIGLNAALSDSTHLLVVWNPATGVYDAHTDLHPGVGYWVRLSKSTDLLDTGALPLTTAPFPIPLKAGWNMIGDPFPSPVALSSLTVRDAVGTSGTFRQAVSGGVVSGTLYAYPAGSTQYQKVGQDGSLTPFDGDWIYAFRDCTLLVPAR